MDVDSKSLLSNLEMCLMRCRAAYEENGLVPMTDDKQEVYYLCEAIENILRYKLLTRTSTNDNGKDYWNFLSECLIANTNSDDNHQSISDKCISSISQLSHLTTAIGKGRALIRWCLMFRLLADVISVALEDYTYVQDWYGEESILLDQAHSANLIEDLADLNTIQFNLPNYGHNLDKAWPTHTNDNIIINIDYINNSNHTHKDNKIRERSNLKLKRVSSDASNRSLTSLDMSLPSEVRLVSSSLSDLRHLIANITDRCTKTDFVNSMPSTISHRRYTISNRDVDSRNSLSPHPYSSSNILGDELLYKLDNLSSILNRLAVREDNRSQYCEMEQVKDHLEIELRDTKRKCLDLRLQLTETLHASELSDAQLLQELTELQEALRQCQATEQETFQQYKHLEQQLHERDVEYEINQELLTQADSERNDMREKCIYLEEELEDKLDEVTQIKNKLQLISLQLDFQHDRLIQNDTLLSNSEDVNHNNNDNNNINNSDHNSSDHNKIKKLQESLDDATSQLMQVEKESSQMRTIIQAMTDERSRLQNECMALRSQIQVLERSVKDKEACISKQSLQISTLQDKSQAQLQNELTFTEQITAMQFQISTHKLEMEDINAKYIAAKSHANNVQRELDEAKNKASDLCESKNELSSLLNTRDMEIVEIQNKIEGLTNEKKTYTTESVDTLQEIVKERNEKQRNLTLVEEENDFLREQILKVTQQKVHLYSRAEDLENELEKFMLGRWQDETLVKICQCGTVFYTSVTSLRKHHCRCCGRVFCHYCVNHRLLLPNSPSPVRVCNGCFQFRESFIKAPHTSREIINNDIFAEAQKQQKQKQKQIDNQLLDTKLNTNFVKNPGLLSTNLETSCQSMPSIKLCTDSSTPSLESSVPSVENSASLPPPNCDLNNTAENNISKISAISTPNQINSKLAYSSSQPNSIEIKREHTVGDYSQIIIPLKKTHSLDTIVTAVGTNIKWEFSSDRGIAFQLSYKSSSISELSVDEAVILPQANFDNNGNNREIYSGEYVAKKAGVYYFTFTNDSNFRQKRLSYKITLIEPSE